MRWAASLALVAALCLATPAERAGAQAAPGAPTGISLLAGAGSFTVSWSAPAVDGGSAITSYDLRHIETAATDKADENWTVVDSDWTSGDLSDTLAGLRDSTGYDVQVRAANALAGSWSDTSAGTTSDHGDTVSAATAITVGSEVPGRIHAAGDTDHFTFTLDGATYVLLEASTGAGTLSLTPTLYDDHGAEVYLYYLNESGWSVIDDGGLSMYALERLEAGTYTIRIAAAAAGQSGSYLLKPQIAAGQVTDEETCEGYSTTQSDPLYGCQWHLKNTQQYGAGGGGFDINVEQAWATAKGEGINVLVVDSGLDYLHSDLRGYEYESGDPNDDSLGHHDPQGSVRHPTAKHGTWVAGVIAARDNDIGTRGVAPRATVYGYTISRGGTQIFNEARARRAAAASHMADVTAVSSNSWRIAHRGTYAAATDEWRNAIESGITSGYGGKGVLYVWLAGNFHANGSYANRDEMLVHHGVTVVCAVNYNDVRTTYSERGDNLWLCAPSGDPDRMLPGIATTALHNEYNLSFGGTSAATPIVSGVAALVRAANTALTWRDVKLILAGSARRNDASNTGWEQGALAYGSTTDRYWFNTEYGFGVVDAGAAVELATGWTNLPPFRERSASASPELAIPDRPVGGTAEAASSSVTLGPEVEFVEYASVELRFSHDHRDDIQVDLTSPAGTVSELFPAFESPNHSPGFRRSVTDLTFHLGASKHLGESAEGTWTLRVSDTANGLTGTLHSWTLTVHGHGQKPLAPGVTSASTGAGALTVAWTAPADTGGSDITSYDARSIRSDATDKSDAEWTEHTGIWSAGDLEGEVTGLEDGVAYDVQLRAVNSGGGGLWSETVGGATASPPGEPRIASVVARDGGLGLTWTAPASDGGAAVDSYDARTILSSSTAEEKAGDWPEHIGIWTSTPGGDLRGTIAGLTNGDGYDVQLRAVNAVDPGSWSATSTGTPDLPADTSPTLVSNAVQGEDHSSTNRIDRSQAFTTSAGATLSSVEIISEDLEGDDATVSLCTVDGSNHPTSDCTPLTAPSSFAAGTLVFRAPANTTLAANTTYSLLIASPGGEWLLLDATESDNEDAGGATDWSIANTFDTETSPDTWVVSDWALSITIKGTLNNAPTVVNVISDQTATSGTAFSYAFPDTTFTDADGDTLTYTATLADDMALPAWLSFSAATRTFSGTPTAAGTVSVKVTASDASDSVSDTFDIVVDPPADTTAPRVASIVRQNPTSSPTNADSLTWRVTFSEAVSNVDAADFVVSGTTATVTAVAAVSGVTGAYDVTASGGDLAGVSATVGLTISSSHNIDDAASNDLNNTAPTGTNDNSYVLDNTAPSVTISGVPSASDAPFTATFTFSEAVTGFAVGDITLTNASVSNFTATSTTVYTALVTPTASGTVTVNVSANAARDAVGNGNTAATVATTIYTPPAITIVAGTSPVTEGTSAVFTLSRAGSTTAALTVNVTVSEAGGDMVAASNEGDRTVTFLANAATATLSVTTASDNVDEANSVVTATISADTGSPAGYSVGTPASAMVTVEDDDTRGVKVSATALPVNEGSTGTYTVVLNSQPTASVTVTPSRTGSSDVTFSPATLTFTTSTWSMVQTVTVTAAQDSDAVDDSATISHAVTGGDYAAVTVDSVVVTVDDDETADTTAPRVASITRQNPTVSPTNADSLTWRVTFSEAVSNVNAADFAVSGTTATVTAVAVSGLTGAYDVSASGGNLAALNATVTLAIAASHNIEDGASNSLTNTTPTGTNNNSYVVDNTAPSVTISGVPATSTAPFTATFTFSEAVPGFAASDITLTNATASSFTSTSTTVYTALVTPTAAGEVTVDVSANAARDAAGNVNTAATQASSTYTDTVIPAVMLPTVTLRTQSVPESIGTAMLVVTLDQPAGDPLSVPWYTLSSTAASPGDYTNGAGTLIIPSGVTNATISITIIDDAVEEPTETVLVLLSPGTGYDLGGSGATVSILDDDGDGPAPSGATVDGATVVLTYNEPLDGASTPSSSAFVLRVAGNLVSITEVSVDGSEVTLTLAAPVPAGQTVSLDHTQPMSNPIQDASGNKAQSFARWYLVTESTITITNPVITVPGAPTALSARAVGETQINLSWTAPGENGGAPISGYKIESSPDGVANWTGLVANTGNTATTYAHIGLAAGTTRHYRVSAINSVGAGRPSNIDDAIASIPSLSLRTQSIPEGIGTAALLVTLNQPAGDPLSVPWYTLSSTAASPGDYTNGAGTLIIPSGVTNATISITIIDDAVEELTETVLVLLSSGTGYDLDGSGATVSILDDDGDGPAPSGATVDGATVVLMYNEPLDGASTPSSSAFVLRVADNRAPVEEVRVDGSEVTLTLASPVPAGQTVSLDYTQPVSNPIQDGSGNKAQSFTRWYLVTGSTITGTVDTTAPTVTISGVPATSDAPFTATFTFSEAVTGFAVGDITLGNATASSFTSTSTTVYTALVTPTAAGAVTVDVPANAAQDAAGNGNTAAPRASSTYTGSATRGVTVSATVLTVTEGSTGAYTVVLDSQPTANVTVTPSRTGSSDVTFSPATLTFTALNWNTVQPVTVTAAQDSDAVDDNATISHAVTGGDYVGVTVESVVVTVDDDESVDTVPGVPTDLSASTGGNTRINLSWTAPGDDGGSPITGYKIEVSPDGNANWTELVANTGTTTTTTYAHIGLAVGTTRHYRVSAINSAGAGDPSNIDDATTRPIADPITGGGGGGGGGPTPSEVDFEWNVKRDIEDLDGGNDRATGVWSDGTTLWVADNADGAGDAIYAYDRASGERLSEREFALHETNRAPRGFWSDRSVVWVSDSGRERLFAYRLADGERLEEREFELPRENRDARGIWSDEKTMWVLDGRADALFAYDFETGELLAEYELADANGDPRGIWSDRTTVWVSDHGAKRLFAYRLPAPEGPAAQDADTIPLERVRDEEFSKLSRASNNSPRGLWSDGDVMYVADESDDRVYSYNMPDAADARLASLTLSGVDIGEFDPGRRDYEAVVAEGVTETVVTAEAMQPRTDVAIDQPDADGDDADGYQVALQDLGEITVTVTSANGSRKKTYRVQFPETGWDPARDPWPHCLRGPVSEGFSLVVYEGGSVEELIGCAESRDIVTLYVLHEGVYVSYILGAPDFVNAGFVELFPDGLPPITPLIAASNGPPSADPFGDLEGDGQQPWPECLRGAVAAGFSLVVYEGGSVDELEACAQSRDVVAVYALSEGEFVSYILGAPDLVTQPFRDLFADGLPLMTPLVARSEGPPGAR